MEVGAVSSPVGVGVSVPVGSSSSPPVGVSSMTSFSRMQPLLLVMAAGQAICEKVRSGLSALPNQSKRQ